MKKFIYYSVFALLAIPVLFLSSCGDDNNEEEVSVYVGDYTIKSATLTDTIKMNIVITIGESEIDSTVTLPPGYDITEMIQTALLKSLPCESPESSLIQLKADQTIYMKCTDVDEGFSAGTWEEQQHGTVLILNLNATAIPPVGYSMTFNDVELVNNIISAKTQVPIPRKTIDQIIQAGSGGMAKLGDDNPLVFIYKFEIEFQKVN